MMDILITREAAAALTGTARRDQVILLDEPTFERLKVVRKFGETFSETLIRLATTQGKAA